MLKSVMALRCFLVSVLFGTGWIFLAGTTSVNAADSLPEMTTDVCVIGGGSGGTGAALAASRAGANVILVEREAKLGGTSAQVYVTSWEPGPGWSDGDFNDDGTVNDLDEALLMENWQAGPKARLTSLPLQ